LHSPDHKRLGFTGVWKWYVYSDQKNLIQSDNDKLMGLMTLEESDVDIKGHDYSEFRVNISESENPESNEKLVLVSNNLKGKKNYDPQLKENSVSIEGKNNMFSFSSKLLIRDNTIIGTTKQSIKNGSPITYRWYAEKYSKEKP